MIQTSKLDSSNKTIFNWLMLNQIIKKESKTMFKKQYDLTNIYENSDLYQMLTDKLCKMNVSSKILKNATPSSEFFIG